jgi:hypothetical protein
VIDDVQKLNNCIIFLFFSIFISNAAGSKSCGKMAGPEVKCQYGGMARNKMRSYATHLYVGFHLSFLMSVDSAWRLVILAKAFLCGFPQSLEAATWIVFQIMPRPFDTKYFPIHYSFIMQSFDTESELLKVFLNKPSIQNKTEDFIYSGADVYIVKMAHKPKITYSQNYPWKSIK